MSLLAPAYEAPSLCTLPCHLLQRVLSWLDPQALCALAQTCSAFLSACSDPQLWPPATWSPVTAALAGALSEATRLPAPLLARQLSLHTHSCFQATLSLCGLRAVLELTDAGATERRACPQEPPARSAMSPADRWLLGLVASPVAALAAEGAAAGRAPCQQDDLADFLAASTRPARGVLCARAERTAVRLQLSAQFTVVTTLRAAANYEEETNNQCMLCPDAVERLASYLLPGAGSGVVGRWSSGLHKARMHALAECTLQKPHRLRASLEHFGGALSPDLLDFSAVAQSVCEADATLALLIDAVSCEAPRREDVFILGGQAVPAASTCAGLSVSRAALLQAAAGALERGICALLRGGRGYAEDVEL